MWLGRIRTTERSAGGMNSVAITHISLATLVWDLGKQCRPRSDAAERSVYTVCFQEFLFEMKLKWKSTPDTPKIRNGLVQLIRMEKSIRQIWVNHCCSWTGSIKLSRVYWYLLRFPCFQRIAFQNLSVMRDKMVKDSLLSTQIRWISDDNEGKIFFSSP